MPRSEPFLLALPNRSQHTISLHPTISWMFGVVTTVSYPWWPLIWCAVNTRIHLSLRTMGWKPRSSDPNRILSEFPPINTPSRDIWKDLFGIFRVILLHKPNFIKIFRLQSTFKAHFRRDWVNSCIVWVILSENQCCTCIQVINSKSRKWT